MIDNNNENIKLNYNCVEVLSVYTPEPIINMEDFSDTEILLFREIIKKNIEIEKLDKSRSKKFISFSKAFSTEHTYYDIKKCTFCSMSFIPFISPEYICNQCTKIVCFICSFFVLWPENRSYIICSKCYLKTICDNRSGKWFKTLSKENHRERVSASSYILRNLGNSQYNALLDDNEEWNSIEDVMYRLQMDKNKEILLNQQNEKSQVSSNEEESTRPDTLTDSSDSQNMDYIATMNVSISYSKKTLRFEIFLDKCFNLPKVDNKLPYTFVKLRIEPFCLKFKPKSNIVCSNSNPVFKEHFKLRLSDNKIKSGNLIITVWAKRKMKKKKFLGEVIIPIFNTISVSNGEIRNYKLKINEDKSSLEQSHLTEKNGLRSMLNSFTETMQDHRDHDPDDMIIPDIEMFKTDPYIYFTMECEHSLATNTIDLKINLLSLFSFEDIICNSEDIKIIIYVISLDNSEVLYSETIIHNIDYIEEDLKLNEHIVFNEIDSSFDFSTTNIKVEISSDNGEIKADSYCDISHLLKSTRQNIPDKIPASIKMKKVEN